VPKSEADEFGPTNSTIVAIVELRGLNRSSHTWIKITTIMLAMTTDARNRGRCQ
jgi:hypothetical protein